MIEGLLPYAEYKESGQEWLGRLPSHWDVRRMKLLLREVDSRSATGKEQLLRVSQYTGVTQRKTADGSDAPDTRAASLVGYKRVAKQDLVVNIMLAWNGSLGASRYDGITSPAYCVYRFNKSASPWYYHELMRLPLYKGRIKTASTGVVESRLRLYSDDLGRIEALVPPPDEQSAIVRFLDHANRKIDGFIRAKRKLIALLSEQKQAIIHRAVTRGLDANVPLKPSGIPWLGEIPRHWEVRRIKYLFHEIDNRSKDGKETHLAMSQRFGLVPSSLVGSAMRSESYAGAKLCLEGDLVLNRLKAHLGVFALAKQAGVISPDYSVFRKKVAISMEYYESVLRSSACRRELHIRAKGLVEGFWRLYTDDFFDIRLPVPPLDEQRKIMSVLSVETVDLNTAIARTEREIALMQEYRTRLTADVVTGKLDVREAAARLPDLPSEAAASADLAPDEADDLDGTASED